MRFFYFYEINLNVKQQSFLLTIFHHHAIQSNLLHVMDFHDQFVKVVMKLSSL